MTPTRTTFETLSLTDMPVVAGALCNALKHIPFAAFYGDMGAGKTTLIKEIVKTLGSTDHVSSPTFSLVNEYAIPRGAVYHFDFYRTEDLEEVYDIGYEEYFFSGTICLVEWPQRITPLLPVPRMEVRLTVNPDATRTLSWEIVN